MQYENAEQWFINLDKAIEIANRNGTVKLIYSTPSQYVRAKNAEPVQWPTKRDDFFVSRTAPHTARTTHINRILASDAVRY